MTFVSELGRGMNGVNRLPHTAVVLVGVMVLCLSAVPQAGEQSDARWLQIKQELFGEREILDGTEVIGLNTPVRALDAAVVPVDITAKIPQTPERHISKLYLVIDNNPSPVAAVFQFPGDRSWQTISTRIRVNAYTDVRVVAELNTGDTYLTSNFVKASGGCSAPALKDASAAAALLGRMKLIVPEATGRGSPLLTKLLIKHPNSSGLQFDQITRNYIPANYVRQIEVSYQDAPLFKVMTDISISEDPAISFSFTPDSDGTVNVRVTDSKGRDFNEQFKVGPPPEG